MPLYVPASTFQWSANTFGSTWSTAAFGVTHTPGTNTKAAWTNSGLGVLPYDVYHIDIVAGVAGTTGAANGYLMDIGIDPAGGTSYTTEIPNLAFGFTSVVHGPKMWSFPLFIKAGSTIGFRAQKNSGTTACRIGMKVHGAPTHPELHPTGTFVQTINANETTSFGTTAFVAGTSGAAGNWTASLGTLTYDSWWWQMSWVANDTGFTKAHAYYMDISTSTDGGTTKEIAIEKECYALIDTESSYSNSSENISKQPAGATVYARGTYTGTTLETPTYAIIHAVSV